MGSGSPSVHGLSAGERWAGDGSPEVQRHHGPEGRSVPPCLWLQLAGCQWGTISLKKSGITGRGDGMSRRAGGRSFRGALGGPLSIHCCTTREQWVVGLLECTTTLLVSSGHGNPSVHRHTAGGSGQWTSFSTLPHCLCAVGNGTPFVHRLTACGHWALALLWHAASLPWGSAKWNSFFSLPHCGGAVGTGTTFAYYHTVGAQRGEAPSMKCHTTGEQRVVGLL